MLCKCDLCSVGYWTQEEFMQLKGVFCLLINVMRFVWFLLRFFFPIFIFLQVLILVIELLIITMDVFCQTMQEGEIVRTFVCILWKLGREVLQKQKRKFVETKNLCKVRTLSFKNYDFLKGISKWYISSRIRVLRDIYLKANFFFDI